MKLVVNNIEIEYKGKPCKGYRDLYDGTFAIILTKGKEAIIDASDLELVKEFNWLYLNGTAKVNVEVKGKKTKIRIFDLLASASESQSILHIDGNKLNNTKENIVVSNGIYEVVNDREISYFGALCKGFRKITEDTYAVTLTKEKETIIDAVDLDKVQRFNWHATDRYAAVKVNIVNGRKDIALKLHQYLMNASFGGNDTTVVDHINGNGLDNRRSNLRVTTQHENCKNRSRSTLNSSGCTGVRWNKQVGKWQSSITSNEKRFHLGLFDLLEDAVQVRKIAEIEHGFHKNHGRAANDDTFTQVA